jgi:hypothetical protein
MTDLKQRQEEFRSNFITTGIKQSEIELAGLCFDAFRESPEYLEMKKQNDRFHRVLLAITKTEEGLPVVGISRNGAIRGFNKHLYIARRALSGQEWESTEVLEAIKGES